jgi:hydroxymethylglutaryl-CoA reductase
LTRAPAFEFADITTAVRFTDWLRAHRSDLDEQVRLTSRYARLVDVDPHQIGRYLHVRFVFETAAAAGQNMTTAATSQICRWVRATLARDDGLETDGDDLVATMLLPSLVTGTVGGGTSLPRQREWLTALGCPGPGGGLRFAEIIAGFALALWARASRRIAAGKKQRVAASHHPGECW